MKDWVLSVETEVIHRKDVRSMLTAWSEITIRQDILDLDRGLEPSGRLPPQDLFASLTEERRKDKIIARFRKVNADDLPTSEWWDGAMKLPFITIYGWTASNLGKGKKSIEEWLKILFNALQGNTNQQHSLWDTINCFN